MKQKKKQCKRYEQTHHQENIGYCLYLVALFPAAGGLRGDWLDHEGTNFINGLVTDEFIASTITGGRGWLKQAGY